MIPIFTILNRITAIIENGITPMHRFATKQSNNDMHSFPSLFSIIDEIVDMISGIEE